MTIIALIYLLIACAALSPPFLESSDAKYLSDLTLRLYAPGNALALLSKRQRDPKDILKFLHVKAGFPKVRKKYETIQRNNHVSGAAKADDWGSRANTEQTLQLSDSSKIFDERQRMSGIYPQIASSVYSATISASPTAAPTISGQGWIVFALYSNESCGGLPEYAFGFASGVCIQQRYFDEPYDVMLSFRFDSSAGKVLSRLILQAKC